MKSTPTSSGSSSGGDFRDGATLATAFDPRNNALNAIRLLLALLVIVWHSFPLTGHDVDFLPLRQLLSRISVDGFFAVSGFLITSSWVRNPHPLPYLRARALRIFPAFWVSLVVTALVIAPLSLLLSDRPFPAGFWSGASRYVTVNAFLQVKQYSIAGTPTDVNLPGVWNGSMWTLFWEFLCYLGVLALGVSRLLRLRWVVPVLLACTILGVLATSYGPVGNYWVKNGAHFGIMFLAGALVFQLRHRLPLNSLLVAVSAAVVILSAWLPDYRVVAALPLAYLLIAVGAIGRHRRLQLKNDLSYGAYIFAFPLQQLLATLGAAAWGVSPFWLIATALTLPVAAASWFLIERPSLRLKRTRSPRNVQEEAVVVR